MSGVFAAVDPRRRQDLGARLERVASRLRYRPWFRDERWVGAEGRVGLGRVASGFFNLEPQAPAADGLVAFVAGTVRPRDEALATPAAGAGPGASPEVDLIRRAYRAHGAGFAARLTGEFVVALWDAAEQVLFVASDRLGRYPTYWAHVGGQLLVAPEVKVFLDWPCDSKRLDLTAMAEFMRFQCLLGERTFFEDVRLLPPSSTLRYDLRAETLAIEPYWNFSVIAPRQPVPLADAVEEIGEALGGAVRRSLASSKRPGLYLTGGLDSRLLLGFAGSEAAALTTVTFGQRNSRDFVYGERLAGVAGTRHRGYPFDDGSWVLEHADLHLDLTDGLQSWIHAHGISTLAAVRDQVDVAMTGLAGGAVVGGWMNTLPPFSLRDDPLLLTSELFSFFTEIHTWPGLSEAEERVLYAPRIAGQVRGRAFDSLLAEVTACMHYRADLRAEWIHLRNHDLRLGHQAVVFARSHFEMVSPFLDDAVIESVYAWPASLRGYKALERAMLQRFSPHLCYVPHTRNGFLPTTRPIVRAAHEWATKLRRKINAHIGVLLPEPTTSYANYEDYLRTDLRGWFEDLLLGPRTRERGLHNPAFLESLWERMQSGREPDMIGKVASIMTYELMLRRFIDGEE